MKAWALAIDYSQLGCHISDFSSQVKATSNFIPLSQIILNLNLNHSLDTHHKLPSVNLLCNIYTKITLTLNI